MSSTETHNRNRDCADERRRRHERIEEIVSERELPMTVDTLTDGVLEWERDRSAPRRARPEVREQLCVTDLPALDQAGVLTFDADRGIVGPAGTRVYARSPSTVERSAPAGPSGRLLSQVVGVGLAVVLFALTAVDAAPLAAVSPTAAVGVSLVAFAALAVTRLR